MKLSAFIFISVGIMALTASCGSRRSEVVHVTDVLKVDTTVLNEGASDTLRLGRMRQGEKVVKGQVLADGQSTDQGEIALGKNVLMVSQKMAALDVIYSRLGIQSKYALLINDVKD